MIKEDRRLFSRIPINLPVKIFPSFLVQSVDISETGLGFASERPLPLSKVQAEIEISPHQKAETGFKVIWSKELVKEGRFRYGVVFTGEKEKILKIVRDLLEKTNIGQIEEFIGAAIPEYIKNKCRYKQISERLNQKQIMESIDFAPPFLRIDKMILFDAGKNSLLQTMSLGMGTITPEDTAGHYNNTIFLAMCGWLMASAASIHLAILFPSKSPQVVEADGVRPLPSLENNSIWKPSPNGTPFLVETELIRKKMQLVIARTNITFGRILYGTIGELKLILTKRESIQSAKEIP